MPDLALRRLSVAVHDHAVAEPRTAVASPCPTLPKQYWTAHRLCHAVALLCHAMPTHHHVTQCHTLAVPCHADTSRDCAVPDQTMPRPYQATPCLRIASPCSARTVRNSALPAQDRALPLRYHTQPNFAFTLLSRIQTSQTRLTAIAPSPSRLRIPEPPQCFPPSRSPTWTWDYPLRAA